MSGEIEDLRDIVVEVADAGPFTADDVWDEAEARGWAGPKTALGPILLRLIDEHAVSASSRRVQSRRRRSSIPVYVPGYVENPDAAGWRAYDEIAETCPECGRKATSWRGNLQHMRQVHGLGSVTPAP